MCKNVQGKSKVQLFFSSCLVDVSVAVIGPSCLSLVMVQGMRLLSRCWWWWWWFTWIKNVIKNVSKWNPRWFKKTVPREDGNKKAVSSRTAQRQHHNINYRIQRQQRQHETTTNSCSLTVGTWKSLYYKLNKQSFLFKQRVKQVAANAVQQPPTHHQSKIQRQQQHRQTPRVSFLIFCVVLKNTDCFV